MEQTASYDQLWDELQEARRELCRLRLERAIHTVSDEPEHIPDLAAAVDEQWPDTFLILLIIRPKADFYQIHTIKQQHEYPDQKSSAIRKSGFYSDETMEQVNRFIFREFHTSANYLLFRSDLDIAALLNPLPGDNLERKVESGAYLGKLKSHMRNILESTNALCSFENTVFISRIRRDPVILYEMYQDTRDVSDYSWNLVGDIHAYDDLSSIPLTAEDRIEICTLEEEFNNNIAHLMLEEASMVLDEIMERQFQHKVSLSDIRVTATARLRNILSVLAYSSAVSPDQMDTLTRHLRDVSNAVSIPEFKDCVHDFFAVLTEFSPRQTTSRSLQILNFIDANIKNPSLNAQMICDRFRISPTYLSKLIKEKAGVGMVEYIHRTRLSKAKPLLAETKMTVEQVAAEVGFQTRYGLIRAFRDLEHTTPTEYRQKCRQEAASPARNV